MIRLEIWLKMCWKST